MTSWTANTSLKSKDLQIIKTVQNAIQKQLEDWGINSENDENLYRHLSNNPIQAIHSYLSLGDIGKIRLKNPQTNIEAKNLTQEQVLENVVVITNHLKSSWQENKPAEPPILGISDNTELSTLLSGLLVKIGAKAALKIVDEKNIDNGNMRI